MDHLKPADKLFSHRLEMLSNVLIEVIMVNEQRKAFVTSPLFKRREQNDAVETLLDTIVHYEISQLCKLWDEFDSDGFSLPTIASLLKGADIRQLLNSPNTDGVVKLQTVLAPAITAAETTAKSQQIRRITNHRNKFIAHPIYRTRYEREHGVVEYPQMDDIDYAVKTAIDIVQVFDNALAVKPCDFSKTRLEFGRHIKPFYDALDARL